MNLRLLAFLLAAVGQGLSGSATAQILTNNGAQLVVQPGATLYVRGSTVNASGSTLTNAGVVQVTGDFTNAGAVASTGWLVFNGATDQTLTSGGASLGQIEVNNTGATGQNRLLVPQNLTITQGLTLTQGQVRTLVNTFITLPQGATVQGEGPGRYVQGNLRVVRDNVSGAMDFGNGASLDATGSPLGTVTVTRTAGLTTADVSYARNPGAGTAKGIDRIWDIASSQTPTKAIPLTFSWIADDDNGLTSFNPAQVWQYQTATSSWFSATPATDASARSIATTATSFSRWTVSNRANPLPVELTTFTAERQGTDAWLRWATASELENDHFDVESSTDGRQFRRIGTLAGRGTSTWGSAYELKDPNIAHYQAEIIYYRLRQVDRSGAETFSPVRLVSATLTSALSVQAYPNPFSEALTIRIEAPQAGTAALVLHDALGRTVWQQSVTLARGINAYSLSETAAIPQGVYLLTIAQATQQRHVTVTRR